LLLLLSLVVFGLWPIQWTRHVIYEAAVPAGDARFVNEINEWNNIGTFPYGLLLWPLILLPYARIKKVPAIISASILSSPYAGAYSMLSAMSMPLPLPVYPLLSLPLVTQRGYDLIVLAPLALVLYPAIGYLLRTWSRLRRVQVPANDESVEQFTN
jgi:hypothetical protein